MDFLHLLLIVGIFLKGHDVEGLQLQWDVRQSRKLLIHGGAKGEGPVLESMAALTFGTKTLLGVYTSKKVMALVSAEKRSDAPTKTITLKDMKTALAEVKFKKMSNSINFFDVKGLTDIKEMKTAPAKAEKCKVYGLNDQSQPEVAECEVDSTVGDNIALTCTAEVCDTDIGGAIVCKDELAGVLLKIGGAGAEGAGETTVAAATTVAAKKRKREGEEPEPAQDAAATPAAGGKPAPAADDAAATKTANCNKQVTGITIAGIFKALEASEGSGFATTIRPTFAMITISAILLALFMFSK